MKVKVESEKVGLKLNIQKTKIMASGPITSWEIDGETEVCHSELIYLSFKQMTQLNKLQDNEVLMGESEKGLEKRSLSSPTSDCILIFDEGSKNPVGISVDLVQKGTWF